MQLIYKFEEMIGKLKGIIESVNENYCIIDVSGVGYVVFCSIKTLSNLAPQETASLLIETHVREDHIHLYGFENAEEKSTFNTLQSVKGVGTRMALAILSALSPSEIQNALNIKDASLFHTVSGVGKKLADRIITELKDKTISTTQINIGNKLAASRAVSSEKNDAIVALTQLGISKPEAEHRINKILLTNPEADISDILKLALKN